MHFEAVVHPRQNSTIVFKKNIQSIQSVIQCTQMSYYFFGGMFVFVMSNLLNKSVKFNSCDPATWGPGTGTTLCFVFLLMPLSGGSAQPGT